MTPDRNLPDLTEREAIAPQRLEQNLAITYIRADTVKLPLGDGTMDIVVAQNTAPYLREFARVCCPGGLVVFVDTAA